MTRCPAGMMRRRAGWIRQGRGIADFPGAPLLAVAVAEPDGIGEPAGIPPPHAARTDSAMAANARRALSDFTRDASSGDFTRS
jgi:hypothetical protein